MHATSESASAPAAPLDGAAVLADLRRWAAELGFSQITVADPALDGAEAGLAAWLAAGHHGTMDYMAAHGPLRARPAELVPGTRSVICARMDYLPGPAHGGAEGDWAEAEAARLADPRAATVSVYARGRDYHKVLRQRLQKLAERLAAQIGPFGHRVFTDSAPLLEVELAQRSGLGWRGKHTLLLSREGGSMFFLGEICTDLPLPATPPTAAHCGRCTACLDVCPTQAILGPQRLDARRCLSYLSIEQDGPIPLAFRAAMGNRIYGCDDCQRVCPWNTFAQRSPLPDFAVREDFRDPTLLQLWAWDEPTFLRRTEGSAIRRIGHARWRRNLVVALGNALRATGDADIRQALAAERARPGLSPLLAEHLDWALAQSPDPA
ncbi:tRNA epoxyqueuosine(34) reductase QueG [Aquariibacter albus]|uniref:Epoxyqueuosine reductase n=1 Tax=Aquariibacter albus TaxID=2759899 RepID=A0A839HFQ5_9BURK|nr:tRNA epoxyqueuosine(34) reductase QueG [Aquariibacter albus]MBB1160715.1 tRNA epoxyqueuosine(34) reductase QueG [Aquariibacter albus]